MGVVKWFREVFSFFSSKNKLLLSDFLIQELKEFVFPKSFAQIKTIRGGFKSEDMSGQIEGKLSDKKYFVFEIDKFKNFKFKLYERKNKDKILYTEQGCLKKFNTKSIGIILFILRGFYERQL